VKSSVRLFSTGFLDSSAAIVTSGLLELMGKPISKALRHVYVTCPCFWKLSFSYRGNTAAPQRRHNRASLKTAFHKLTSKSSQSRPDQLNPSVEDWFDAPFGRIENIVLSPDVFNDQVVSQVRHRQ